MKIQLLLALLMAHALTAQDKPPEFRLTASVVPSVYRIDLKLVPGEPGFEGKVDMTVSLRSSQSTIWLHARNLDLGSASGDQPAAHQTAQVIRSGTELVGLQFPRPFSRGKLTLRIEYHGKVDTHGDGMFAREYQGHRYLLTQFEPDYARSVVPCFDEPGFKAVWQFTIRTTKGNRAFTNAPLASEESAAEGLRAFRFYPSKPLPPYLLAIGVGPFEEVSGGKAGRNGTPIRIIVPVGDAAGAEYAARTVPRVLVWFEDYLGVPFPFAKLDVIAIPGCASGAMEHPGLITMCRPQLLAPPQQDSDFRQRDLNRITAHEMAHQWFGNLVTPSWWDDLWLSEGFANWLQTEYMESTHPEWAWWMDALRQTLQVLAMDRDGMLRGLHDPVGSREDVGEEFGPAAYVKGAAVLAMFNDRAPSGSFRSALRQYLKEHAYSTATSQDLVGAVRRSAGATFGESLASFVAAKSAPVVQADLDCIGAPFLQIQRIGTQIIPLFYETGSGKAFQMLSPDQSRLPLRECPQWFSLNPLGADYYEMLFKPDQVARLTAMFSSFTPRRQATLLIQLAFQVQRGALNPAVALDLVQRANASASPELAIALVSLFRAMQPYVTGDLRPAFARTIVLLLGHQAAQLGWKGQLAEKAIDRIVRTAVVPYATLQGHDASLGAQAVDYAKAWLRDESSVPPELLEPLLVSAASFGDGALFDAYEEKLRAKVDPRAHHALLAALGSFSQEELEQRAEAIAFTLSVQDQAVLLDTSPAQPHFTSARVALVRSGADPSVVKSLAALVRTSCNDDIYSRARAASPPQPEKADWEKALDECQKCILRRREYLPDLFRTLNER